MKKWYHWAHGSSPEDLEFHRQRLLKMKDVVDVRVVSDGKGTTAWRLDFAKELTSDEVLEVKTRQTSLLEAIAK